MTEACRPRLIVCTTCRAGEPLPDGAIPAGERLHDALHARIAKNRAVDLLAVSCMANCERGCSAAIAMPGKWTYLLGFLQPSLADDVLAYAASYAASATGTVLPSRRPASLRGMILGRVPHLEPFV